jgi:NAD(P)H-flavin reductase
MLESEMLFICGMEEWLKFVLETGCRRGALHSDWRWATKW